MSASYARHAPVGRRDTPPLHSAVDRRRDGHRPRRHRDCGLLAPGLTDKIDPIRYTPKTIGDFASRRAHQQNQSLKPTGGAAATTEGQRRGKHRAELPRKQNSRGRRTPCLVEGVRTARLRSARLEALELTLLAVLPLLPPASRAIVRSNIAGFMDEDITTPPASLVPTRHAQLFRDTLRGQMQAMIEAIDRAG